MGGSGHGRHGGPGGQSGLPSGGNEYTARGFTEVTASLVGGGVGLGLLSPRCRQARQGGDSEGVCTRSGPRQRRICMSVREAAGWINLHALSSREGVHARLKLAVRSSSVRFGPHMVVEQTWAQHTYDFHPSSASTVNPPPPNNPTSPWQGPPQGGIQLDVAECARRGMPDRFCQFLREGADSMLDNEVPVGEYVRNYESLDSGFCSMHAAS